MKPFIDLAADMGWEYYLVDANWNFIPEPDFLALTQEIKAMVGSGVSRNVEVE